MNDLPRHRIIKILTAQLPEKPTDAAINLWELMATQIISVIGESGFSSIYARSLFLTQSTCPWLPADSTAPEEHRFAALKKSLDGQPPSQANEANNLLLTTFTDILASLIGETLTNHLLDLAWGGNDALDRSGNEVQNE
ncbi:MAG: hypothetical protein NTY50_02415 [Methylobacter sp.]|nr:hypothetical protein [Methylobacter sp.]